MPPAALTESAHALYTVPPSGVPSTLEHSHSTPILSGAPVGAGALEAAELPPAAPLAALLEVFVPLLELLQALTTMANAATEAATKAIRDLFILFIHSCRCERPRINSGRRRITRK